MYKMASHSGDIRGARPTILAPFSWDLIKNACDDEQLLATELEPRIDAAL